jgi:hypothetical protein
VAEYDRLGRERFLKKYGFGRAQKFFLKLGQHRYDSKAIIGAAYGFDHPVQGPLSHRIFSGGEKTVARRLTALGFTVIVVAPDGSEEAFERIAAAKLVARVKQKGKAAADKGEFDPENIEDARERVLACIAKRQGQPQFRNKLLDAYGGRCAISDCDCAEALEAAHIHPYRGTATHHITNGLLLRADLHTLFDLGLIGIDADTYTVVLSRSLSTSAYKMLAGKKLRLPADPAQRANAALLDNHRQTFGL